MALTTAPEELLDKSLTSALSITVDDNSDALTLISTDADANVGPVLLLDRNSSSPADSDVVGSIDFDGRNDAGQSVEYAQIISQILDASDGTEDGALYLQTIVAGTKRERISLLETETVLNNASVDLDFRVESDSQTHALYVNADADKVEFNQVGVINAANYFSLQTNTSDGSDNSQVALDAGAGGGSTSRGAFFSVYGNEHASQAGEIYGQTGASGKVSFKTGSSATDANLTLTSTELTVGGPTGNSAAGVIDIQGRNHSGFGSTVNARSRVASRTAGSSNAYHSELVFSTTNTSNVLTERGHFDEAGDLHIADGNLVLGSAHGIDFTNSGTSGASTDTQLLDDYEKGTWTMSLTTSGSGFAASSTTFTGQFVKVGRIVTAYAYTGAFNITNAGTGIAKIDGLPFNSAASATAYAGAQLFHTTALTNNSFAGYVQQNDNFVYPTQNGTTSGDTWKVANGVYIMFQATYVAVS